MKLINSLLILVGGSLWLAGMLMCGTETFRVFALVSMAFGVMILVKPTLEIFLK